MFKIFSVNPIFGVDFKEEEEVRAGAKRQQKHYTTFSYITNSLLLVASLLVQMPSLDQLKVARVDDDVEILDDDTNDAFAAYFADGAEQTDREITFDNDIGLACEALPDGWTMQLLWKG